MSDFTILLGITGSEHSQCAAEAAWMLSKKCSAQVYAEHIIDTKSIWQNFGTVRSGMIGSGPYISLQEDIVASMTGVAEKIQDKYCALAEGQGILGDCALKTGDPVETLKQDATRFNLLVLGKSHDQIALHAEHQYYMRYHIGDALLQTIKIPTLIVQQLVEEWTSLTIISEVERINHDYLEGALHLAKELGLKARLEFLAAAKTKADDVDVKTKILECLLELKTAALEIDYFEGNEADERKKLLYGCPRNKDVAKAGNTLCVLPMVDENNERKTIFGLSPETLVESLTVPAIMLWPASASC